MRSSVCWLSQQSCKRRSNGPRPEDRSKALFSVIAKLISLGLEDKAIENIVYAHPKGIGATPSADRNDLDKEISRIIAKSSVVDARPIVQIRGGALPTIIDQAEEHLVKGGYNLFQRGSLIVRPVQDRLPQPDGYRIVNTRLVQVRLQQMREQFSTTVDFQRLAGQSGMWVSIDCPRDVAEAYLERKGEWPSSPHPDHNHTDVAACVMARCSKCRAMMRQPACCSSRKASHFRPYR